MDIVVKLILLYHIILFHAAEMKVFWLKEFEKNNVGITKMGSVTEREVKPESQTIKR